MAKKNVLVIVDYQKDFVDGALGFSGAEKLDTNIKKTAEEFLNDENGIVVCTFDTHLDNYLETQEGRNLPVAHCIRNTDGWKLYGETGKYIEGLYEGLAPIAGSTNNDGIIETDTTEALGGVDRLYLVEKPTFPSLKLGDFLRELDKNEGVESITFAGLVSNICVFTNAVVAKAACPEAEIIIPRNLTDSFDKELEEKMFDVAKGLQMTVK